jgi:hypothetical protein
MKKFLLISLLALASELTVANLQAMDNQTPTTSSAGSSDAQKDDTNLQAKIIITMPDKTALNKLFSEHGLDYFAEKTKIIEKLAGQTKYPEGLEISKQLAIYDYSECLKGHPPFMINMLLMTADASFDAVIDEILKDFPKAKEQLQDFKDKVKNAKDQ